MRELSRLRQEDFADAARQVGLTWTRSTVTSIETGRRQLSPVELLLLTDVVRIATLVEMTLGELLEVGEVETVALTPVLEVEAASLAIPPLGVPGGPNQLGLDSARMQMLRLVVLWWTERAATVLKRSLADVDEAALAAFARPLLDELFARLEGYPELPAAHRLQLASSASRTVLEELRTRLLRDEAARGLHVYEPGEDP